MEKMRTLTLGGIKFDIEDDSAVSMYPQFLTDAQKKQARTNIGAVSQEDVDQNTKDALTGYATEKYVREYAQPKGEYLTAVPDDYAKTEDIPTKPEDIGAQPVGNYLTEVPSGYAKEEWVQEGYQPKGEYALVNQIPSVPKKVSAFQNDAGYLTEHQDISGKLDANKLPEAVNDALAQAKASGEFKGDPGYTPKKNIDYFDGEPGDDGKSAYQIAVDNGFEGTEEEWLESLHGKGAEIDEEQLKPFVVPFVTNPLYAYPITDIPVQDIIDAYNANKRVLATLNGYDIGQLSGVFGNSSVSFFFDKEFLNEDKGAFTVFLYSDGSASVTPVASGGSAEGAVLYTEQTLTEDQKAQARANIGSVSGAELEAAKPFFVPVEINEDDGSASTEVPFADIVNAYGSNRLVYALVGGIMQFPLVQVSDEAAIFLVNAGAGTVVVSLFPDGTGFLEMMETGGGGEAETFVVPVTLSDDTSGTIDVPFEEIANAVSSGKFVYATIGMMGAQLPLAMFSGSLALFSLSMAEGSVFLTVLEDGTAEMAMVPAGGGGGSFVVTVTDEGGTLVSDTTFEEIMSTIASGRTVIAVKDNTVYHLGVTYSGSVLFFSCLGNSIYVIGITETGAVIEQSTQLALYSDLSNYVRESEISEKFYNEFSDQFETWVIRVMQNVSSDVTSCVLKSPCGKRFKLTVSDHGELNVTDAI